MAASAITLDRTGRALVLIMVLLQGFYAIYAFVAPVAFAELRGTSVVAPEDLEWVRIYASRTAFVALIVGWLLVSGNRTALKFAALAGTVMPITDAVLAYRAGAANAVVIKHVLTIAYLAVTFLVLHFARRGAPADRHVDAHS